MRVMLVTGSFPPMKCGVGDYTEIHARVLATEKGVEVAVVTDRGAERRESDEPYRVYPVIESWRRSEFEKVAQAVRDFRPDIVHIQYPTLGYRNRLPWMMPVYLRKMRVPVVQTWHEYFPVSERPSWRDFALAFTRGGVVVVRPDYLEIMPWWYRLLVLHKRFEFIPIAANVPRASITPEERAEIRSRYSPPGRTLLAFFGFFYEHKGIDDLLEAIDPERHFLLMVGQPRSEDPYQARLFERIAEEPLSCYVRLLGFLPGEEVARILAAVDAVVLPFRRGGGVGNGSLHAATAQGTFTVTTSTERRGYDSVQNVYYVEPGNVREIRTALDRYAGTHKEGAVADPRVTWSEIVDRHLAFYRRYV